MNHWLHTHHFLHRLSRAANPLANCRHAGCVGAADQCAAGLLQAEPAWPPNTTPPGGYPPGLNAYLPLVCSPQPQPANEYALLG